VLPLLAELLELQHGDRLDARKARTCRRRPGARTTARKGIMSSYAPLIMVGGFLAFGIIFVIASDIGDALSRWGDRKGRTE
jgi:hypothetical protein